MLGFALLACCADAHAKTARVFHYTAHENVEKILASGILRASTSGASGPGVYVTAKSFETHTKSHILENNYCRVRSGFADAVIELYIPEDELKDVSGYLGRDVKIAGLSTDLRLAEFPHKVHRWTTSGPTKFIRSQYVEEYSHTDVVRASHQSSTLFNTWLNKGHHSQSSQTEAGTTNHFTKHCNSQHECYVQSNRVETFSSATNTDVTKDAGWVRVSTNEKISTLRCANDMCISQPVKDQTLTFFSPTYKTFSAGLTHSLWVNRVMVYQLMPAWIAGNWTDECRDATNTLLFNIIVGSTAPALKSIFYMSLPLGLGRVAMIGEAFTTVYYIEDPNEALIIALCIALQIGASFFGFRVAKCILHGQENPRHSIWCSSE